MKTKLEDAEIQSALRNARAVEDSINRSEEATAALKRAISARNVKKVAAILHKHGLEDVTPKRITLFSEKSLKPKALSAKKNRKGKGATPAGLVCLHWRYWLKMKFTWQGIDWEVVEWCDVWAHG